MTTDVPTPRRTSATTKLLSKIALAVVGALGTALVAWASQPPAIEPAQCPPPASQPV